jgi:hypothetical protein
MKGFSTVVGSARGWVRWDGQAGEANNTKALKKKEVEVWVSEI